MIFTRRRRAAAALLLALSSTAWAGGGARAAAPGVTVDVFTGTGATRSVTATGQVVGTVTVPTCPFLCSPQTQAVVRVGSTVRSLNPSLTSAFPVAQNDAGTVVGTLSTPSTGLTETAWLGDGARKRAVPLGPSSQYRVTAVDATDRVLATRRAADGSLQAVLFSGLSGTVTARTIGTIVPGSPAGDPFGADAVALSSTGWAAGSGLRPAGKALRPWVWRAGTLRWLPVPAPWTSGGAVGVNSSGWVAGSVSRRLPDGTTTVHAALWRDGVFTDLGTLGGTGSLVPPTESGHRSVNDLGQVLVEVTRADGSRQAALWEDGALRPLATPAGSESRPVALDSSGRVLGFLVRDGVVRARMWVGGAAVDLGSASGVPAGTEPTGLNDAGDAVGFSGFGPGTGSTGVIWHVRP